MHFICPPCGLHNPHPQNPLNHIGFLSRTPEGYRSFTGAVDLHQFPDVFHSPNARSALHVMRKTRSGDMCKWQDWHKNAQFRPGQYPAKERGGALPDLHRITFLTRATNGSSWPGRPWLKEQNSGDFVQPAHATVAQLVEQLTRNEQVAGSSPAVGSRASLRIAPLAN